MNSGGFGDAESQRRRQRLFGPALFRLVRVALLGACAIPPGHLTPYCAQVDADGNGRITFNEFFVATCVRGVHIMCCFPPPPSVTPAAHTQKICMMGTNELIRIAFDVFDRDGDGCVELGVRGRARPHAGSPPHREPPLSPSAHTGL